MGVKRSVPDGYNGMVKLDYDEFKARLKKQGSFESQLGVNLIKQYFPAEHKRDQEAKIEAQRVNNEANYRFRWNGWFDEKNKEDSRRLKQLGLSVRIENNGHANLLAKATRAALLKYQGEQRNWITNFSGWLFRLDHPKNEYSMLDGKKGERHVQCKKRLLRPKVYDSSWAPIFIDDFTDKQKSLECSSLLVNGAPIYGKPDYMYFNESTKTALIIEVKISNAQYLPPDSWPNVRAQLWAYAHLDLVKNKAQSIVLIGEVWGDLGNGSYLLRKTYRWEHFDTDFYKENEALFECFQKHASYRQGQVLDMG